MPVSPPHSDDAWGSEPDYFDSRNLDYSPPYQSEEVHMIYSSIKGIRTYYCYCSLCIHKSLDGVCAESERSFKKESSNGRSEGLETENPPLEEENKPSKKKEANGRKPQPRRKTRKKRRPLRC